MRNHRLLKTVSVVLVSALIFGGCGLIPKEEKEYKVQIVKENVADSYALATAETGDVVSTKRIGCIYSQLNEAKLSFAVGGRRVANVYVNEGDEVTEGELLAMLDISALESQSILSKERIQENTLKIAQEKENIAMYDSMISGPATSLKDREDYILEKQQCEERIVKCESDLEYHAKKYEECEKEISLSYIYSPMNGIVASMHDDLVGWTADVKTTAITLIDTSMCAFMSTDKDAVDYVKIGDSAVVTLSSGVEYATSVTAIDEENKKVVFELDEPDFSLSVGTRANATITIDRREQVLVLPRASVFGTEDMHYVYVLNENGVRELVVIEAGLIGDSTVEILGGIEANASVILKSK